LVDGLVVANAHRVSATSSEAFIIRLYRIANQQGFIKAGGRRKLLLHGGSPAG
jgi:DNA excision repair protein ERCC-4